LCAIRSPHSFTTTGKPSASAASTAASAVATVRSGSAGTPYGASRSFDAASDSVGTEPEASWQGFGHSDALHAANCWQRCGRWVPAMLPT
jgi:hypothetical protein